MKQFKIVFVVAVSESTSPKTDFNKTCTGIFSKFFFYYFCFVADATMHVPTF